MGQFTDNDAFSLFIAGENSLDLRVFNVSNSYTRKFGRVNILTNFKSAFPRWNIDKSLEYTNFYNEIDNKDPKIQSPKPPYLVVMFDPFVPLQIFQLSGFIITIFTRVQGSNVLRLFVVIEKG